jgi:hypothetical protein
MGVAELQQRPAVLADDLAESQRALGQYVLFALGAVLLCLFVAGAVIAQTHGGQVRKTTPEGITRTTTSATGEKAGAGGTTSTSTKKTARATVTEITTVTPQEGILLALLGTGTILLLAAALYTRLTAIKLPGGAELTLSPAETQAVTQQVAAKVDPLAQPTDVARATSAAILLADERKRASGGHLALEELDDAADRAVRAHAVGMPVVRPAPTEEPGRSS